MNKIQHLTDLNVHDFSLSTLLSVFEEQVEDSAAIYDFSELLVEGNEQGFGILKCEETEHENEEPSLKKARL